MKSQKVIFPFPDHGSDHEMRGIAVLVVLTSSHIEGISKLTKKNFRNKTLGPKTIFNLKRTESDRMVHSIIWQMTLSPYQILTHVKTTVYMRNF